MSAASPPDEPPADGERSVPDAAPEEDGVAAPGPEETPEDGEKGASVSADARAAGGERVVAPVQTTASPGELTLHRIAPAQRWTWRLLESRIELIDREDGGRHLILRADAPRVLRLTTSWRSNYVSARLPEAKLHFRAEDDDVVAIAAWLGPQHVTRTSMSPLFMIVIGALFFLGAMPLDPDPSQSFEGKPFDVLSCCLGASAAAIGVVGRFWPRYRLVGLDSIWLAALAVDALWDILVGVSSWIWLPVPLFLASASYGTLRFYGLLVRAAQQGWARR